MAKLRYLPLESPRDFRLIEINPGSANEPLILELYHSTLDDTRPPSYEALSYVWGYADNKATAYVRIRSDSKVVNYSEFSITHNLAVALRHLRHPLTVRTVWVDAICINQQDNSERTQQVLIMANIYRLAHQVVAFLGPEADESSCAMDLLEKVGNAIEVDFSTGLVQSSTAGTSEPGLANMQQTLPYGRQEYISIHHLIHREWFERLWIRQEIGLGDHKGILQCGNKLVRWHSFCNAIFVIHRKPTASSLMDLAQLRTFQDRLAWVDNISIYARRAFGLVNLREQIGRSKCSDPRDRIYGILSQLLGTVIEIIPDYSKPVVDVYTDLTQRHINHSGRLDILSQCELDESYSALSLPSWVPDWSTSRRSEGIHELAPKLFHLIPMFSNLNQRLLRAYGIYVTRVAAIKPFNKNNLHSENDTKTAWELRRLLLELANSQNVQAIYDTRDSFLKACCRNLWLNNFRERWIPPVPHEPSFDDCVRVIRAITEPNSMTSQISSLPDVVRCLRRCREACTSRILFITEDGHIGIASDSVVIGDEVCFLFGCFKPMMLRPVATINSPSSASSESNYRVVSECHVDGAMYGEFVLGKLSDNLHGLLNTNSSDMWPPGFKDINSNVVYEEDSRTRPFLEGLKGKGLLTEPTLEELERVGAIDTLIHAGFSIKTFDLI